MCSAEELHKTILNSYYKQCTLTFYTLFLWVCAKSLQACPTLCDTMDHSLPGSSGRRDRIHGILQGLPCPPPGGLSNPRVESTSLPSPTLAGRFFYHQRHLGSPFLLWKFPKWTAQANNRLQPAIWKNPECGLILKMCRAVISTLFDHMPFRETLLSIQSQLLYIYKWYTCTLLVHVSLISKASCFFLTFKIEKNIYQ